MYEKIPANGLNLSELDRSVEDELFGKWFPRIGALAVVLGAGFGFKYAIDQGWVGARLRVMLGILLGSILIGIGDWARKREWSAYAHAITGGGVGIMYLTLWASVGLYKLVPSTVGFLCLVGVSGLGCALALRHESQTLALLSVIGGFVSPFVTGASSDMPHGLYLYVLAVDLAVVALSFIRPWNLLEKVAFVGSWIVLEVGGGSPRISLMAASGIFLMFGALPYARVLLRRGQGVTDLALVPINGLLYYFAVFVRLTGDLEDLRGPFTLALATFFLVGMFVVRGHEDRDGIVASSSAAMSFLFLTLWAPVQLGIEGMAMGWAIEALALLGLSLVQRDLVARAAGWIVLGMSAMTQLAFMAEGLDAALAENYGRVVVIVLIAALYLGSYVEHEIGSHEIRDLGIVAANVMTVLWLSLEVYASVWYGEVAPRSQDLQFGLSGVWSLYASVLLGAGIVLRARQVRMMSLVLFGITIFKMAIHDLWLLDTLQRLIGFVGIGALLLVCSLMYHRFRDWLLPSDMTEGGAR